MFSVAVLAVVLYRVFTNNPDQYVGPVMVPLYESTDDISLRGLHATDDTVVVVGGNLILRKCSHLSLSKILFGCRCTLDLFAIT